MVSYKTIYIARAVFNQKALYVRWNLVKNLKLENRFLRFQIWKNSNRIQIFDPGKCKKIHLDFMTFVYYGLLDDYWSEPVH
jgi:hypothetical protein